jgi:aminocarboxymuconate-semialdehyde decarboxylase
MNTMTKRPTIDIHTHILTDETMGLLAGISPRVAPIMKDIGRDSAAVLEINGKVMQKPVPRGMWDVAWRLREMDENGVDYQLLLPTTQTFYYEEEPELGLACAALQNDQIAKTVSAYPKRFIGMGTVPMQAPQLAADELRRAMTKLGLRGVQIGSNICSRNLDDPALEPFWAAAEELGAFIFIHPHNFASRDRLTKYLQSNTVGLPFETTLASTSLVWGGVMDRHPNLKVCLSHGGGYMPYQRGRFIHSWHVRDEPKTNVKNPPDEAFAKFYVDSIVHSKRTLEYLVDIVGHEHVLLGSDYPFDMGNLDCVKRVEEIDVPPEQRDSILGGRAEVLLNLSL